MLDKHNTKACSIAWYDAQIHIQRKIVKIQSSIHSKEDPPQYQRTEQHQDSRKHARRDHVHSNYHQKLAQRQTNLDEKNSNLNLIFVRLTVFSCPDMGTVLECLNHTDHVGMLG